MGPFVHYINPPTHPHHSPSIHFFEMSNDGLVCWFGKSAQRSNGGSLPQLFLTGFTLQVTPERGGVLHLFTNHNKENNPAQITSKGKEHEDESKPIFASQPQVIVLKLYQNCSKQEERASGMRGVEKIGTRRRQTNWVSHW